MTAVDAVLFDKDGTLVDFYAYWIPISEILIQRLVARLKLDDGTGAVQERLMRSIGIDGKIIMPGAPVACGTGEDIAEALADEIGDTDPGAIRDWMNQDYREIAPQFEQRMTLYPGSRESIERLVAGGMKLGVATADTSESALYALEQLGLREYFSFVGGSDLVHARKPDPELARLFCESVGVSPDQIAMVGDTPVDMEFARNAGVAVAVAVLTGAGTREELTPLADVVIRSVADLADLLLPAVRLP